MRQVFLVQAFVEDELYTWGGFYNQEQAEDAARELDAGEVYDFTRIQEHWIYDGLIEWASHEL